MDSPSTCVMSPMARCASRLMVRSRLENNRITSADSGMIASATRVRRQFSYSSQANRPATVSESRTSTVRTVVAALVTLLTSKAMREISVPDGWLL